MRPVAGSRGSIARIFALRFGLDAIFAAIGLSGGRVALVVGAGRVCVSVDVDRDAVDPVVTFVFLPDVDFAGLLLTVGLAAGTGWLTVIGFPVVAGLFDGPANAAGAVKDAAVAKPISVAESRMCTFRKAGGSKRDAAASGIVSGPNSRSAIAAHDISESLLTPSATQTRNAPCTREDNEVGIRLRLRPLHDAIIHEAMAEAGPGENVPRWLEFHDSTLRSITQTDVSVHIVLDGYVHRWEVNDGTWRGTGWEQSVRIIIRNVDGRLAAPTLPVEIADGWLSVGEAVYDNLVRIPVTASEPINLRLEFDGQETLDVAGGGVRIEPVGEPRFIEDLPADLRPPTNEEL